MSFQTQEIVALSVVALTVTLILMQWIRKPVAQGLLRYSEICLKRGKVKRAMRLRRCALAIVHV